MPTCPSCGRPNGPGARRCMYCAAPLGDAGKGASPGETVASGAKAPPAPRASTEGISFSCPRCSARLRVPLAASGKNAKCSKCGGPAHVPSLSPEAAALPFDPDESLETAYKKTLSWLKSRGLPLYDPGIINSVQ